MKKMARTFAHGDRELAALTTVEAIRSYAASHGGKLPAHLEDIMDTPAPNNPATDKPFDYHVNGQAATLSDSALNWPMEYSITIRK